MNLLRSFVAVLVGYGIFTISAVALFRFSGRNPHAPQSFSFMLLAVVYGIVFAAGSGIFAARAAARRGNLHAALVAMLIALGAILSLALSPASSATWSQWLALLVMAPCAWLAPALLPRQLR